MCQSNYSTIRTFLSCFNSLSVNRNVFPQVKGLLLTGYKCRRCFLLLFFNKFTCVFFSLKHLLINILLRRTWWWLSMCWDLCLILMLDLLIFSYKENNGWIKGVLSNFCSFSYTTVQYDFILAQFSYQGGIRNKVLKWKKKKNLVMWSQNGRHHEGDLPLGRIKQLLLGHWSDWCFKHLSKILYISLGVKHFT